MAGDLVRPKDLPPNSTINANARIPADDGSKVYGPTLVEAVNQARPFASQPEAEVGANTTKAMNSLTTKQSIAYEVGRSLASKAQGSKADTAVQPGDLAAVATSGSYADLSGAPHLAAVATSGSYNDLIDKPTLSDTTAAESRAWAMSNLHPVTAPSYIRTAGYGAPGDSGGALYKKVSTQPAHVGKFSITLNDGSTVAWYEIDFGQLLNPFMFGAKGDGAADDGGALNTFFNFISVYKCVWESTGKFLTGAPIIVGRSANNGELPMASRMGYWDTEITTTYTDTSGYAVLINCLEEGAIAGTLRVVCGDAALGTRRQRYGIFIKACSRSNIGDLYAYGTIREGILVKSAVAGGENNNNNLFKADALHARNSGYIATTTVTSFSNTGSAGSLGQRTVATVPSIPAHLTTDDFIVHKGRAYQITAIGSGTVEVFPWLVSVANGDTLIYHIGGGITLDGGDVSINNFGHIDVASAPVGMKQKGLYGPFIQTFHYNYGTPAGSVAGAGIGFINGISIAGSLEGCFIGNFYVETASSSLQYLQTTVLQTSTVIGTLTSDAAGLAGFQALSANLGDGKIGLGLCNLVIINHDGRSYGFSGSRKRSESVSSDTIDNSHPKWSFRANSITLHLKWNEAANDVFGYDSMFVLVAGGAGNGGPSGTVTFDSADGKTVNGRPSVSFTTFTATAFFTCIFDYTANNWFVSRVTSTPPS